MTADEI